MLARVARKTSSHFFTQPHGPQQQHRARASLRFYSNMSFNAKQFIEDSISGDKVFVFSKSWCPYCRKVKSLFDSINVKYGVVELDKFEYETEVQSTLAQLTGQRTVPSVFIGKKHVGGFDDTSRKKNTGELKRLLTDAGVTDAKL